MVKVSQYSYNMLHTDRIWQSSNNLYISTEITIKKTLPDKLENVKSVCSDKCDSGYAAIIPVEVNITIPGLMIRLRIENRRNQFNIFRGAVAGFAKNAQ